MHRASQCGQITTHEELVGYLDGSYVHSPKLLQAFSTVDRMDFVPKEKHSRAYSNCPLPLTDDRQSTISQPSVIAQMLEWLELEDGQSVLEVGSGCGYVLALLGVAAGVRGRVFGVERNPALVEESQGNLSRYPMRNVKVFHAAEGVLGLPGRNPFDRILVSAAMQLKSHVMARQFRVLTSQLAVGGKMVYPVRDKMFRTTRVSPTHLSTERCGEEQELRFSFVTLHDRPFPN